MPVSIIATSAVRVGLREMAGRAAVYAGRRASGRASQAVLRRAGSVGVSTRRTGLAVKGRAKSGLKVAGKELRRSTAKSSVQQGLRAAGDAKFGKSTHVRIAHAMMVEEAQRLRVPEDTGKLREAVKAERTRLRKTVEGSGFAEFVIVLDYAPFVIGQVWSTVLPGSELAVAMGEYIIGGA